MSCDLTAVVNLHREGRAAAPSLVSAHRSVEAAVANGISTELLLVLDTPDADTRSLASSWDRRGARVIEVDAQDLGHARNAAVAAATSPYIAFLDGDDLWSENWLCKSIERARDHPNGLHVFHPQLNVIFGDHHSILHHIDSTDGAFSWARARLHNPWTALSLARTADLQEIPYPSNRLEEGFGFEDWSWNLEVLHRGGRHHAVPGTSHFIRRTLGTSLLDESQHALRSPYPASSAPTVVGPGRTTRVSPKQSVSSDLPPTYRRGPLAVDDDLWTQITLARTIEPQIGDTVSSRTTSLPQNHNTHVTPEQRALEELDLLLESHALPDALRSASILPTLSERDTSRVVAEALRDSGRASDLHAPLVASTLQRFPQLRTILSG